MMLHEGIGNIFNYEVRVVVTMMSKEQICGKYGMVPNMSNTYCMVPYHIPTISMGAIFVSMNFMEYSIFIGAIINYPHNFKLFLCTEQTTS